MGALALGVVLIIGYFYQSHHPYRRLNLVRSTGYHIYFKAGLSGIFFLLLAFVIWLIVDFFDLPSAFIERYQVQQKLTYISSNPPNWIEIKAVIIFLIAFLTCFIYVQFKIWRSNKNSVFRHVKTLANDLERLVINSTVNVTPIRVELDCGKVYVGLPETPNLEHGEITYITLLPLLSGYVDDTKKLIFNNNYYLHYEEYYNSASTMDTEHETIESFSIVLPVSEIVIASQFSIDAFIAFRNPKDSVLVGPLPNSQ